MGHGVRLMPPSCAGILNSDPLPKVVSRGLPLRPQGPDVLGVHLQGLGPPNQNASKENRLQLMPR